MYRVPVYLLTFHSNDCVFFLITVALLFYNSCKDGDYTNAKLKLERNAICNLVITDLIMILNTRIFCIPGSRVVAGKCSVRMVMPVLVTFLNISRKSKKDTSLPHSSL